MYKVKRALSKYNPLSSLCILDMKPNHTVDFFLRIFVGPIAQHKHYILFESVDRARIMVSASPQLWFPSEIIVFAYQAIPLSV